MEQCAVGGYGGLCCMPSINVGPSRSYVSIASTGIAPHSFASPSVRHSLSTSSGFFKLRVGRETRKVFNLQTTMAELTAEAPASHESPPMKTRKIVEHAVVFKMMDSLDEVQEKNMLDSLYTLQYQIKDIITTSLGPLLKKTPDGYTHALFTRFTTAKALQEYLVHPARDKVAMELIIPFFKENPGLAMVDFESEVEDDMETIFRRGDRFSTGCEQFLMFKFRDNTTTETIEKSINAVKAAEKKFGEGIVQTTIGTNIEPRTIAYFSHGIVRRFESESAYEEFMKFLDSEPSWAELKDITENLIEAAFSVAPIGKTLM